MSNNIEKLYNLANNIRQEGHLTVCNLLEEGINEDIILTYDELYSTNKIFKGNGYVTPKIICEFLSEYIKGKQDLKMLDPWCHYGELLNSLTTKIVKAVGLNPNINEINIASKMLNNKNIEWIHGNPIEKLDVLNEEYDLIASCLPFNLNRTRQKFGDHEILDSESNLILLKASKLLSKGGIGFFVVSPGFWFKASGKSVKDSLEKYGLFIDAVFYLTPGTFQSTPIASYLIAISKIRPDELFVAEIGNKDNINTILLNWRDRKIGKVLSLGYLIEVDNFISYEKIDKELEIKRLVKKAKLTPVKLEEISIEINKNNIYTDDGFEDKPNSIYLPVIGLSKAVSRLVDITLKPQNYIQIVLDPKQASADYVASWFNTELGKIIRESLMNVTAMKRISKSSIINASLYLPNIETQIESVNIQTSIASLRSELNSIEGQLLKNPDSYRSMQSRLRQLNRDTGLEDWIEKLPFPLASILWKYYATKDIRNKKDYLLYFFEALAQFEVVLMLSAFYNDKELLTNQIDLDFDKMTRSTFGAWVIYGEQLAKLTRELMSSGNKDRCLRMYRKKKKGLIEVISSKKVFQVLKTTKDYRNDWKGHGGIEGERESKSRLKLLEVELIKIREAFGDIFEDSQLIKPGKGYFESGLYKSRCSLLMGTRSTFKEIAVKTMSGIDINQLYLIEEGHYEPLEILPFIRLLPSPNTNENVCYFYNRIDKNGVRMVSYYFDRDSEINIPEDNISSIFNSFTK